MELNMMNALGKITYGLYIVTTKRGEDINGMIASWVSQISFDPPLLMVAIRKNRYSHTMIKESGIFALNIVSKDRNDFISRFKAPTMKEKFEGISWKSNTTGAPIVQESVAFLDCTLEDTIDTGDHTLFVGKIIEAEVLNDLEPMTCHDYGKVYIGQS